MDYIRAAFFNARSKGLTGDEIWQAIEHSETPSAFDANINAIVHANDAMGQRRRGMVYSNGGVGALTLARPTLATSRKRA